MRSWARKKFWRWRRISKIEESCRIESTCKIWSRICKNRLQANKKWNAKRHSIFSCFCTQYPNFLQRSRPPPAAETGRRGWGSAPLFQSPAKGLRKNQQTQPVRRRIAPQAISPVGCCLARGSHPIGMSNVEAVRECREIERFHDFFAFSAWHAGSFAPRPKTAPFPEKQHNPREHFRTKTAGKRSRGLLFYSALLCRAGFEARRFYAFTSRFCSRRYASANIAASQSTQLKKNSAYWPASMSVLRLAFMPACIRA